MTKKLLTIMAFVFSLVLGQAVFADCGGAVSKMVESLKLDDSQKAKIKPILDQLKATVTDKATQMDNIRNQFMQQLQSTTMDQTTVNGLVDQKTQLIGDVMKAKFAAITQVMATLNDQQKAQLQKQIQNFEQKKAEEYKKCHDDDE